MDKNTSITRLIEALYARIATCETFSEDDLRRWFDETKSDLERTMRFANHRDDSLLPIAARANASRLDPLVLAVTGIQEVKLEFDEARLRVEPR